MHACMLSCFSFVGLCPTPWTAAHQAPPSTEFSRQEYWSGFPCPSPGDLPDPGIVLATPALLADALGLSHQGNPTWRVAWHAGILRGTALRINAYIEKKEAGLGRGSSGTAMWSEEKPQQILPISGGLGWQTCPACG